MPLGNGYASTRLGARWLGAQAELGVVNAPAPALRLELLPTYEFDPAVWRIIKNVTDLYGATDVTVYTVPDTERLWIHTIYTTSSVGDRNISGIKVAAPNGDDMRVTTFSAAGSFLWAPTQPLWLGPGWSLRVSVTGGSDPTSWEVSILGKVVDAAPGGV
jgi:hypothetical protein